MTYTWRTKLGMPNLERCNCGLVGSCHDFCPVGSCVAAIDSSESSLEPSVVIVFHSNRWQLQFNDSKKIPKLFNDIQECYLQKRRHGARQSYKQEARDVNAMNRESYHAGLEDFQSVLSTFTRYSRLRVIAELRHGDLFHSANIVSREFDRDDELFATAGVSRRIKVFEFALILGPQLMNIVSVKEFLVSLPRDYMSAYTV